jgi:hypothetical protein
MSVKLDSLPHYSSRVLKEGLQIQRDTFNASSPTPRQRKLHDLVSSADQLCRAITLEYGVGDDSQRYTPISLIQISRHHESLTRTFLLVYALYNQSRLLGISFLLWFLLCSAHDTWMCVIIPHQMKANLFCITQTTVKESKQFW